MALEDRPDRRQLGNEHLISFWPVRGGPVIADGTVYFGAGIWPIFGVFFHALDVETGKARWSNNDLNYITKVAAREWVDSGLSPQGYFALLGGKLAVPCGRSHPAGLDAATGKLIYYVQGYRKGDSCVVLHGDYVFVGRNGMLKLTDFREAGPPLLSYKMVLGCDASSAFDNGISYGAADGVFYSYDVANAKIVERDSSDPWGNPSRNSRLEPPVCWQYPSRYAGQKSGRVIKAGKRLYGYAGKKLLALANLGGQPCVAWEKDCDGTPASLIVADKKLFVATLEGSLHCFGEAGTPPVQAKNYDYKPTAAEPKTDAWPAKAQELVNAAGVKSGYCLVLGLADGRLIEELLKQTELLVLGVDADEKKVERLRREFWAAGVLGTRVELFVGRPFEFGFPPYLASLIVSEDLRGAGFPEKCAATGMFERLHPYGGTFCVDHANGGTLFERWIKESGLRQASARQAGHWALLVRERRCRGPRLDARRRRCGQHLLLPGRPGQGAARLSLVRRYFQR